MNARPLIRPTAGPALALALEVWGATDRGQVRSQNEDTIWPIGSGQALPDGSYLLLVADGVGGAQAGDEASRIVAGEITRFIRSTLPLTHPGQALAEAVQAANTAVYDYVSRSPTLSQAASTATVALVIGGQAHIANVGDSRTYLIRGGKARQWTQDHTLTQQKIKSGRLNPAEADLDEDRNVITRSLGSAPTAQVDVFPPLLLQPGDTLLLCSDGLTDMLSDTDLARLTQRDRPRQVARRLIGEANRRGGHDNISVVIGRISNPSPGAAAGILAGWPWPYMLFGSAGLLLALACVLVAAGLFLRGPSNPAITQATPIAPLATPLPAVPLPTTPVPVIPPATTVLSATQQPLIPPTSTSLPTYTPAPIPTLAGPPPAAAIPTSFPTLLPEQPTPSLPPLVGAPILAEPSEGDTAVRGHSVTFKWRWSGQLAQNQGFEVRVWREDDPDHYGAFDAQELPKYIKPQADGLYLVSFLIEGAYSVRQHGTGIYYWSVAVVELKPYVRAGAEASPRRLIYTIPGPTGSGDDGGSNGTNPEPPAP